jgi:two-component sensor histidine kinase
LDQEDIMTEFANQRRLPQEQILLDELNHRVNNEFTNAISIVSLAAAASSNGKVKGALSRVADLLHRFADVHRALQMPEYDTLVDAAVRSVDRNSIAGNSSLSWLLSLCSCRPIIVGGSE